MLESATQSTRELAVNTPFGMDALLLRRFSGREDLSRLFEYELEMVSENAALDPAEIVGQNVTWVLAHGEEERRFWNGFVSRFRYAGSSDAGTVYRASVVPWLWFLTQTTDCRIFQNKTTPQIIEQIFTELGFTNFRLELHGDYEPREYCVQYRESDFNFVSRLMEEEGIFYFFEHDNGEHRLVLADDLSAYFRLPDFDVEMADPDGSGFFDNQLTAWEHEVRFRPGRWTQTDYNFKSPRNSLMTSTETVMPVSLAKRFEVYDYPGGFEHRGLGNNRTTIRMQEHEADHDVVFGECSYRTFTPGGKFRVESHHVPAEEGREYVVRGVFLEATVGGSYDVHLGSDDDVRFECRFEAIPAAHVFRPPRAVRSELPLRCGRSAGAGAPNDPREGQPRGTPKPVVEGPQTAIVTGPPGEEIYPDEFGRVKVQFHWDREGQFNEHSSCWLRVSQTHAGAGWGMMDLPRIGEEVIVSFLEGDPDRPIITGRVYNGDNRPPFNLPDEKTRRGNKTKTYQGNGYNEMSMDDTPGQEQIRIHAQHDMDTVVGNNETHQVGVDQVEQIGSNAHLEVGANQSIVVGDNRSVDVGADAAEKVGGSKSIDVGDRLVVNAGTSITLKCGASTIHMNKGGVISISGVLVTMSGKVCANVAAPLTNVAGMLVTKTGAINLDTAAFNQVAGGVVGVQGGVIKLNC
jgi:type VI secretion system secreted protein VgrG